MKLLQLRNTSKKRFEIEKRGKTSEIVETTGENPPKTSGKRKTDERQNNEITSENAKKRSKNENAENYRKNIKIKLKNEKLVKN
jgi:hypothetical protein